MYGERSRLKYQTNPQKAIEYSLLFLFVGILLLAQYRGSFTGEERFLFLVLMIAYLWIAVLLMTALLRFNLRLFEPLMIVSVIYFAIFIMKPMADLNAGKMMEHNVNVLPGGTYATALFVLGYTVLFAAYYLHHKRIRFQKTDKEINAERLTSGRDSQSEVIWLCAAWAIVYMLCLLSMMTQGLSLRYIFSFGAEGTRAIESTGSVLLFLSNFGVTLVALWLMILDRSESVFLRIAITVLCVIYILMRNARWLALVFLAAPIVLYYAKRNRQPRMVWVAVAAALGISVFAWMQANRYGLARGRAMVFWGVRDLTLENLLAPLETDMSTYRAFYSMVVRYPHATPFLFGRTFAYTLVLFVPRALWAGKPDNPVRDMIEHSLNARARVSGTAVANVGELYANFGVVGIIVGMYLFGWILSLMKRRFVEASEKHDLDFLHLYAVLFPLLYQWVARGNFCGNFYLTLFAMLPYGAVLLLRRSGKRV